MISFALTFAIAAAQVTEIPQPATVATPTVVAVPAPAMPVAQPMVAPVAADLGNQVVCRATVETGSLIKKHKVCLTRRQWVTLDRDNGSAARHMIENNPGAFRPQ